MNSIVDAQSAPIPKLPLGRTISLSYSTFFRNFLDVLRISWLCLLVAAPLMGVASWIQWSWMTEVIKQVQPGVPPQLPSMPFGWFAMTYSVGLLPLLAGVSIAVAWHRRIILDERPHLSGSNIVTKSFWRYIGVGILIALAAYVPAIIIFIFVSFVTSLFALKGAAAIPVIVLMVAAMLTALAVMLRLSLLLPARAVGNFGATFKEAWRRSHGNTWRLFWGLLACTLPPMIVVEIVSLVLLPFPTIFADPQVLMTGALPASFAIIHMFLLAFFFLILPISIGFLSLSYLHFFEPTDSAQAG